MDIPVGSYSPALGQLAEYTLGAFQRQRDAELGLRMYDMQLRERALQQNAEEHRLNWQMRLDDLRSKMIDRDESRKIREDNLRVASEDRRLQREALAINRLQNLDIKRTALEQAQEREQNRKALFSARYAFDQLKSQLQALTSRYNTEKRALETIALTNPQAAKLRADSLDALYAKQHADIQDKMQQHRAALFALTGGMFNPTDEGTPPPPRSFSPARSTFDDLWDDVVGSR